MSVMCIVSRSLCRLAAILFVAVMMMSPVRAFECSEHSECGTDVYCIEGECTTCFEDPSVCWDGELCQYPDECFCNSAEGGVCTAATECLSDGYPQSGLGYCSSCDDVWHLCPTMPYEYWCSWLNECRIDCETEYDCPDPYTYYCSEWNECVSIG